MKNLGVELSNCYIPGFMVKMALGENDFSKIFLYSKADENYGKLNLIGRISFTNYISDLEEEGVLSFRGNYGKFSNEVLDEMKNKINI